MKRIFFTILFTGIIFQIGFSQNFDKDRLDHYFDVLEANNKFMGSVAVSRNGKIIYAKSVGFSDYENKIKADENSKYRIGSISKTFTAVLVLKAAEDNKLDLDQTIGQYFPTIRNAEKITIKNLLNHQSGIHNFTDDEDYLTWNTQPRTEEEMISIIADAGSDFEPGSRSQYSNSNFVLLTYILEKCFQRTYAELLKRYITQPAGLNNTYLGGKTNTGAKECKSYRYTGAWEAEPETDISIPLGAGGIVSTPGDLVKFSDALFSGKLLEKESLEIMKTFRERYGTGLFQIPFYDKTGYGHTGGIDGFSSVFSYFPDGEISYAMTSNGTNFNDNNISIAVLSAVYDKPYNIPEFTTYDVSAEELDSYSGIYSSALIPLKITITKNNKTLIAQAAGQLSFPLEATAKGKFKFDQADVVLEFDAAAGTMLLRQGGEELLFTKEQK